jgi:Fe-S-cluster containining protein
MTSDPYDALGLFRCTKCGECCKGYGGTYVTPEDIDAIAKFIGVERHRFVSQYCVLSGGRPLLAQADNGYCLFWDTVCTIHPVKPRMCRQWPYIPSVVTDIKNWHVMAANCPGMRTDLPDEIILRAVQRVRNLELSGQ